MKKAVYMLGFIFIVADLFAINAFNIEEKVSPVVSSKNTSVFYENFSSGVLDSQKWQITHEGDFKESIIDVYDIDPSENIDYNLRLGISTIGTIDDTVKFQGVRSVEKVNFSDGNEVSFNLDWNNQSNGCYLTGSFYLCPTATNANPEDENDWMKLEYIGVPPGRNARSVIANRIVGDTRLLYSGDWPQNRTGRKISNQHIKLILNNKSFKILENGNELYSSPSHDLNFTSAYIYLQMSSHSNYPLREIYFDNIIVTKNTQKGVS
ncbi:hypothetical protein EQO05_02600 [Methanosarcina sp. MSH10X1]|uniref:hypothetical protein n=1 Tax=Methanosarcina sp. MSH10X1 TaxID=2507075 RepID=UPI000FFC4869|nr:hypothetical protein [Methanosarcina sp. MSH10X1]RXA21331.1 hypothetical protein EQO05_02600 [Methanosarcina sp. MSH10X1]